MADFFTQLNTMSQALSRTVETLGVPYADPFNEEGIIVDVNDPKNLGRVKVTTKDDFTSDWVPVAGSSRGKLSAKYVGTRVLLVKTDGRSENMYVSGVLSGDGGVGVIGTPLQIPIIDESLGVWSGSSDPGMQCNEGNEGRAYVLSNEFGQDLVICLRRNSPQLGGKNVWAWKSVTNGLWVEKGFNPGNSTTPFITQSQLNNPGIPECNEALLGERHDFSEDRGFRTTSIKCRRDENGGYSWVPDGATPVFFRTTLPTCSEAIHGSAVTVDDGNNSEFMVCQRYQGQMKWVRQGRRVPHKFSKQDKPITRSEFLEGFKSIPELEEADLVVSGYDWAKEKDVATAILDATFESIPITGTDPELKKLLGLANLIPSGAFDRASALKRIANAAVKSKTGIPADEIIDEIKNEIDRDGKISPAMSKVISGVGSAADVLINGAVSGSVEDALVDIGKNTLVNTISSLNPQAGSVVTGLMTGGVWGAIDASVAIGLDRLPPEAKKYVGPVVDIAKDLLKGQPLSLSNIVSSAMGGGLSNTVSSAINSAIGANIVSPSLVTSLATSLASGALGPVSGLFNGLGNLSAVSKLPAPANSLPLTASTALGLAGIGKSGLDFFGKGGIGLSGVQDLLGPTVNPSSLIAAGVPGLSGLLSGVADKECPCGEKCRKTEHGSDRDGNNLLKSCSSVSSNNANSYSPNGSPLPNNSGPIAQENGLEDTKIGSDLIPSNILDLSEMIKTVSRAKDMAETVYQSRFADQTEKELELASSFEAVEKSLKVADNNITRVESIERKLIDSMYTLLQSVVYSDKSGEKSVMTDLISAVKTNSEAIRDLYNFAQSLNGTKSGGDAGVRPTKSIDTSIQNISNLASLSDLNKKNALKVLNGGIIPADKEWRGLNPSLSSGLQLGTFQPTLPTPFDNERTLFDTARVLSESVESKLTDIGSNGVYPQSPILTSALSANQLDELKQTYLSPTTSLYDSVTSRKGETNCS